MVFEFSRATCPKISERLSGDRVRGVGRENHKQLEKVGTFHDLPDPRAIELAFQVFAGAYRQPHRVHVQTLPNGDERTRGKGAKLFPVARKIGGIECKSWQFGSA